MRRLRLDITGAVQGVGFRPYVYHLACSQALGGFVCNTGDGAAIEIEGTASALDRFLHHLGMALPPHAAIDRQCLTALAPRGEHSFVIAPSTVAGDGGALVLADLATCESCLSEVLDPADRRYLYPFTSCTRCGPRYSIIEALPYDRVRTTMRHFPMCSACAAEYSDPNCRRFHAEPIACPECGPQLALWNQAGAPIATCHAALLQAADALCRGLIVALKGLGGFQLLVDAANEEAVRRLRLRKQRPRKPFAIMVPSLTTAEALGRVGEIERRLLVSSAAPIVLIGARPGRCALAPGVAPGNPTLGIMMPYTPLHHLLLRELGFPVIATSGNRGNDPIVADQTEALEQLGGIADCFLVHDRPILRPIDDSVVRVMAGREVVLRRARGYASTPFLRRDVSEPVLALGGQQKSALAWGGAGRLFVGPHIGDLSASGTRHRLARMATDLPSLHAITPLTVACDMHPDYYSTRVALGSGLPVSRVPHHLAHVLACMIDNDLDEPVLGVAWDGTGYGTDGTIWGGEFLVVDSGRFRRVAHLWPFRLPGGEAAVREPRRAALGVLYATFGEAAMEFEALPAVSAFTQPERAVLATLLRRAVNAPLTSSAGRLFDAVAAVIGLCQRSSFEGEAAMEVEFAADRANFTARLPSAVVCEDAGRFVLDWRPLMVSLIEQYMAGVAPEPLAAALHDGLTEGVIDVARRVGLRRVMLTGGCFQNARLTERTVTALRAAGFIPYWHHQIPPNDGGLAAGQALFASRPLIEEIV